MSAFLCSILSIMRFISTVFLTCCLYAIPYAQFPASWIGKYSGTMFLSSLNAPKDSVVVSLEIVEIIKDSAWTYTMSYKSEKFGDVIKDYKILKVSNEKDTDYLMDENNGILLEMTLFDDTFYEYFEVENMIYTTRLSRHQDSIEFEIIGAKNEPTSTTLSLPQSDENTQYEVNSYKPLFAQKVILKSIE